MSDQIYDGTMPPPNEAAATCTAIAECSKDSDGAGCDYPGFCEHKVALVLNPVIQRVFNKQNEELLASLLHQQVLTNEASHRVKNSLQLVSSLLRIQSASTDNEDLKRGLLDAQARIIAIAQVHDLLGHTNGTENIDLSKLVVELCKELQSASGRCKLIIQTELVFGSSNIGNSLALIISELVTNACKYAYPAGVSGSVWISLQENTSTLTLIISDKGCGLPADFNPDHAESLGMRLVFSLVQQLRGSVTVAREGGASFMIKIPRHLHPSPISAR